MRKAYTTLAKYYDLLYQDKDYRGESEFIKRIVKKRVPNAKSILDVGCGTGIHLNLLLNNFDLLHGVDLNSEVLRRAKKKSSKVKYTVGSMADFSISKKFDVITCLFSVFNYNLSDKEAKRTLRNIKRHLEKDGLAIFALYTPRNTKKKIRLHFGRNPQGEVVKINQFEFNPKTRLETSDFLVLIKDRRRVDFFTETDHRYKIYGVDIFKKMLKEAGFVKVRVYDNFVEKPVSSKTKYPVFVTNIG